MTSITDEMIEELARAWASIDGKRDIFDRCKEDADLEEEYGSYGGYIEEAKELLRRSPKVSAALTPSAGEAEPVAWQWRSRIKGGAWDAWENGRYGREVPPFMEVEERPLFASPSASEMQVRGDLYSPDDLMADGGDTRMTAAEEVLAYLLIEVIGVPDDEPYSPNRAQIVIETKLRQALSTPEQGETE